MNLLIDVTILLLCYVVGAIPTGLIMGLKLRNMDVREHGSKNIGATNVWRVFGWKMGLSTMMIDVAKAFLVVWYGSRLAPGTLPHMELLCAAAVLIGNMFNVFLGFKGGKGIATSLGVFLAVATIPILVSFALFNLLLLTTGYVSVGSIAGAAILPVGVFVQEGPTLKFWAILIIALLVIWKHRANLQRLANGTENRVNIWRKKDARG